MVKTSLAYCTELHAQTPTAMGIMITLVFSLPSVFDRLDRLLVFRSDTVPHEVSDKQFESRCLQRLRKQFNPQKQSKNQKMLV